MGGPERDPILEEHEQVLWEKGILGEDSPDKLRQSVFFNWSVELQESNFFVFCVVFQLLEVFCFEFLHAPATGNDDVISTAELCHDIRNRPSNLVLVVEFLILLSGIQRNIILLELMLSR